MKGAFVPSEQLDGAIAQLRDALEENARLREELDEVRKGWQLQTVEFAEHRARLTRELNEVTESRPGRTNE